MALRFTLQPQGAKNEHDIGSFVPDHFSFTAIRTMARALAADSSFGSLGHVRVYDAADICLVTSNGYSTRPGYHEALAIN